MYIRMIYTFINILSYVMLVKYVNLFFVSSFWTTQVKHYGRNNVRLNRTHTKL